MLRPLSDLFPKEEYPALVVGLAAPDDSAVYQLDSESAIISTTDFFPPVVDDAYDFGAIAAANALSDVYAMGGRPLFAINLAAFPDGYDMSILTDILRGGGEKVREAGAVVAGGHTVADKEPKYGLAVTGVVHPERIIRKSGAKSGDRLILSKPLGVGVVTTALKRGLAEDNHIQHAVDSMKRLNKQAAEFAQEYGVHAMTDITGYGLLGHGHEMAHLSGVNFRLEFDRLGWLPGAMTYAQADLFAGGLYRNKEYFGPWVTFDDSIAEYEQHLLFDPQTSGGLLMSVAADKASSLSGDLLAAGDLAVDMGSVLDGDGHIEVVRS